MGDLLPGWPTSDRIRWVSVEITSYKPTSRDLSEPSARFMRRYGTYGNWITSTIAAVAGASQATPIAGAGHHATPAVEQLILIVSATVAVAMVGAVVMLVAGLWRGA
jgi:hypothetical protein